MEADNGMLAELQSHSPIVLRMYRWSCPTLSLGHFQDEGEIPAEERWSTAPRVRRKTGGGAILHDLEWTYSLVIPSRPELGLKGHSEAIYRSTHLAIVNGLREMGWDAKLSEQCTCSVAGTRKVSQVEPFLCFMRRSPVDVLIGQDKILGSAETQCSGLAPARQFSFIGLRVDTFLARAVGSDAKLLRCVRVRVRGGGERSRYGLGTGFGPFRRE